jgi:hypothetical protein
MPSTISSLQLTDDDRVANAPTVCAQAPAAAAADAAVRASRKRRRRKRRRRTRAAAVCDPLSLSAHSAGAVAILAPSSEQKQLGVYTSVTGGCREVVAIRRADRCVLVVDRDSLTLADSRLVACIQADEPSENAGVVCALYLDDENRGRCRQVAPQDLAAGRPAEGLSTSAAYAAFTDTEASTASADTEGALSTKLTGRGRDASPGYSYRLHLRQREDCLDVFELCWCREQPGQDDPAPVCLREVVGALESYEPACELTLAALARYRDDSHVSTTELRVQLERVRESPIVLNRKLRQAVLDAGEQRGVSLSEIALRCGRIKRNGKGGPSGETSWLARRVGLLPESGSGAPTPWVHSDVLALIARNGLGVSPREVELG